MSGKTKEIRYTIPSKLNELRRIEKITEGIAKELDLSEDQQDNLSIAVTEAVGNAIVHGNKKDPSKTVQIVFRIKENSIRISIQDQGGGFNPDKLADPLDPKNLMKESGRGLFILKSLMGNVSFQFSPQGTTVQFELKKKT